VGNAKMQKISHRVARKFCFVLVAGLFCSAMPRAQESTPPSETEQAPAANKKSSEQPKVRLNIQVTGSNDKPIANASVYVRYNQPGGLLHKEKLAELDLKTNGDGSVRVPAVPQGMILVQVIAPGWHTYGKWYEINKDEESIAIKLAPPTHWY
jgi:hypothetical protein